MSNDQPKHRDPVCGKHLEDARTTTVYKTNTYVFCSNTCKKEFEKNPDKYIYQTC
jgi:YHS domain-containing protein